MKIARRAFVLGALMFPRIARADAVDDKLAAITRARANVKTLVGPFTQLATVGLLRSQIRSTGTLYLQYPNRLRWELGPPDSIVYWVAPEGLAYRGLHGGGRIPANTVEQADVDALRAMLGGNVSALRTRFDVREIASQAGGPAFECTPKSSDAAARLKKLAFELDADLVRPKSALIVYDNRNQTAITFGELRRDAPIDPALLALP
jgi:hypothetical protein